MSSKTSLTSKVVLLGDTSVGKTSLLNRIINDSFEDSVATTVGASYSYRSVEVNGIEIKFQIWDTAGQERYRCLSPIYCRDAQLGFIVFSVNERKTFDVIDFWVNSLVENGGNNVLLFLIGNKVDLPRDENGITTDEAQKKADEIRASYIEVSAKDGIGVEELVQMAAQEYFEQKNSRSQSKSVETPNNVDIQQSSSEKKESCC